MKRGPWSKQLSKKVNRGYPAGTIAFYGPDDRRATKVVVGIAPSAESGIVAMEKWSGEDLDVRVDPRIGAEVLAFIRRHGVRSVITTEGIFGRPHEKASTIPKGGLSSVPVLGESGSVHGQAPGLTTC